MTLQEGWNSISSIATPAIAAIIAALTTGKYLQGKYKADARKSNAEANNLNLQQKIKEDIYDDERYKKTFERMVKAETERDQYYNELMTMKQRMLSMEEKIFSLSARVNMLQSTAPTQPPQLPFKLL